MVLRHNWIPNLTVLFCLELFPDNGCFLVRRLRIVCLLRSRRLMVAPATSPQVPSELGKTEKQD